MQYKFSDISIDTTLFELRKSDKLISVEPLIFNLLVFFVENTNEVLNKQILIENIWQGRIVSDATISGAVKVARKAIGDNGKNQFFIKTIHGRGFRFVAEIQKQKQKTLINSESSNLEIIPCLTIPPMKVLNKSEMVAVLSEEIVSDLKSILARIPLLQINSSSVDDASNNTEIKELLLKNNGYLLQGSISFKSDKLKVSMQLTDIQSKQLIWSESFIRDSKNEEKLVADIISLLEPQLNRAVYKNFKGTDLELNSRELYLQASSMLGLKGWHKNTFAEAADLLRKSEKLDPSFALSPAYLSLLLALGHRIGILEQSGQAKEEAIEAAERAMKLDNMNSTVLGFTGCALADVGLITRAIPILKNAVHLHAGNAQAWVALGSAFIINKDYKSGIEYLRHGIDISPLDSRLSMWQAVLALALLHTNEYKEALLQAELACQKDDRSYMPRVALAAISLCSKELEYAKKSLDEAYRIKPDLSESEIVGLLGNKISSQLIKLK